MYEILENDITDVAIIGMAVRLPGIKELDSFWQVIEKGTDNLNSSRIAIDPKRPDMIQVQNKIDGKELFDGDYFNIPMQEAELMDPQHRIFLECVNDALLHAGYTKETLKGITGVFGSTHLNTYLLNNLLSHMDSGNMVDSLQTVMSNEKDHVAAFTAYKMNFTGPAVNIQSTCSSSLAGVHLACESLQSYSCDTAVVGAATVDASLENGYVWEDNGILSKNGCCRPYDSQSTGTVYSDGAGAVILKRLTDAVEAQDTIYGVIKGTAINNDGSERVGYTAPGVKGQVEVITRALSNAGVSADSISYIEGHGTGTMLGDNIEITALKEVFSGEKKNGSCALGSIKANFGHTGPASGIIGLMKTVLALNNRILPPQIHFQVPNGALETMDHPFYINTNKAKWDLAGKKRRAGVSSFGLGGSNVHVIVEEAPRFKRLEPSVKWNLLVLSGKDEKELKQRKESLIGFLERRKTVESDLSFTLQNGRDECPVRYSAVFADIKQLPELLKTAAGASPDEFFSLVFAGNAVIAADEINSICLHIPKMQQIFSNFQAQLIAHGIAGNEGNSIRLFWLSLSELLKQKGKRASVPEGEKGSLTAEWYEYEGDFSNFISLYKKNFIEDSIIVYEKMIDTDYFYKLFYTAIGWLWEKGERIRWPEYIISQQSRHIGLPGCPYQKRSTWINGRNQKVEGNGLQPQIKYTILDEKQLGCYQPPDGFEEALVIDIWQEELRMKPIGTEDNYFELGGNSILAAKINRKICELFRQEISLKEFLEEQNVRNLVRLINRKKADA